jgi:CDP-glucose 4,6-dehydratase
MENMEQLTHKKVLVTGGAGFIGSHVVLDAIAKNNHVAVIDNLSSGRKENIPAAAVFYEADVRDKKIAEIFAKEQPNVIFHFAAQPLVEKAYEDPYSTIETNVMGTVNVLEICRNMGNNIEAIVIVSSDKAYGKTEKLPYQEISPLQGDHPYDASKSAADLMAKAYAKTYGMPVVITRFSNVFGPGDMNFSRLIPGFMEAVILQKELLLRSDGTMVREYTYVKDIAAGCITLAANAKKFQGQAFNFGSHNIFSVIEVIEKLQQILGQKITYKIINSAKNEIPKQYLDWSKAKENLRWQPAVSFEDGIQETFKWYREYFKI